MNSPKSTTWFGLPLLGALFLCACATASSADLAPSPRVESSRPIRAALRATELQPLAIGNSWSYRGTMAGQPVSRTVTIERIEDGFFVDDASGRLKLDSEGLRDDKRYLLKEPIARGHKWMAVLSVTSTERYEIVETDLAVDTPKGRFEGCVQVRAHNRIDANRALESDWLFAPGVGIVRIETRLREGDRQIPQSRIELVDYRLAQP
ncbi:MAG: hypothetical protein IKC51_03070 [Myxococcaceae bacterium]|nr:hypothetical protein [Myxococcaceae bacterium]